MTDDEFDALGWWTISGAALMGALREVADGADPEMVYMSLYANSEVHPHDCACEDCDD